MKKHKWRKGPPPSIGWWPASADQYPNPEIIRWWNGTNWSQACTPKNTPKQAGIFARYESDLCDIQWTDRWWL